MIQKINTVNPKSPRHDLKPKTENFTFPPVQRMKTKILITIAFVLVSSTLSAEGARWWKGNLHTHSLCP